MAIINNNVGNVKFLRNGSLYGTHDAAYEALTGFTLTSEQDGTIILARYGSGNEVKTLAGLVYYTTSGHSMTIIDIEGASGDVNELRQEINAKLGDGVSSANTVTAQLTALSGNSSTDTSATTSVEGAKKYAYDLISTLDGSVSAETGYYVKSVSEVDGKISGTTEALPSFDDTAVAKKFVVAVDETNGQIAVERGEISSSAQTMVLTDNADGGVNFEVNIDGASIVQDPTSKKIKVADSALTQYFGDEKTIHAEVDATTNKKTFNTLLKIVKNANPSETEVKEEYFLADVDGTAITGADTIKIYKDSHIVSITYITDSGDTHYQNLEYKYIDASGATKTEYVDISSLVLEAEFASGLTIENHVARGVVDPQSEKDGQNTPVDFLTVGADGFKISGIKDEIDRQLDAVVEGLDADESGSTEHITVNVVEEDGVITTVTVEEDNIANADDLAELSGKTITAITSTNGSIAATISNEAGNKTADIQTDASKIKMSGFTADASGFTAITEASTITEAVKAIETAVIANEEVVSEALNDLRTDIDTVSGDVDTIKEQYISGVSVNGNAVTVANHVAPISISAATSATTASTANAIVVDTDANGNITLGLNYIDCGTY